MPITEQTGKSLLANNGQEVTVLSIQYKKREDKPTWKGRPYIVYRLNSTNKEKCEEFVGYIHSQSLDSIKQCGVPNFKSLTPGSQVEYLKYICTSNYYTEDSKKIAFPLEFCKEEDGKVVFKYLDGRFKGFLGRKRLAELKDGVTENDPRPLLERMRWLKQVLLPGCKIITTSFPSGKGGRQPIKYFCPEGHYQERNIGYVLQSYGGLIPCNICNQHKGQEKRMMEDPIFASEIVNLYIAYSKVHGYMDERCSSIKEPSISYAYKIGFYENDPKFRSRKYKYFIMPHKRLSRMHAYLVEQKVLDHDKARLIYSTLSKEGHKCDGYMEMINIEKVSKSELVNEVLAHIERINKLNNDQCIEQFKHSRRENYDRSNSQ
ncbi:hypothetical protein [Prochlorococcus sp. MIT 1306]|uniref:hypothetical protein n=1 Tax=Prochlorococcus sp. MIT 1306 TaxID=1799667 RepID=UPI0007B3C52F|nr:hypothetical protein [Prochlorococcus sp. MIT 1306]KZR64311.1 hypothetical protein PMIT1306_01285 [Prochlorococcus sp. MIT 1306]